MHVEDTHYHFLDKREKLNSNHITYKECNCRKERQERLEIEKTLKSARIPEKFLNASINNFSLTVYEDDNAKAAAAYAKRIAARFVENYEEIKEKGKGLYFHSQVKGSGKTRLMISIGNALFKKYRIVPLFISANDILNEIKSTFDSEKSTSAVMRTFREANLLLIDDLGVEESRSKRSSDPSVWKERVITEILEHRMNNNLLTIITANIPISDLSAETLYPSGRVESRVKKITFEIHMPEYSIRDQESVEENQEFEKQLLG
ncbi:DnaA ATPase domain-containing protein [Anaerobacillus alkalilacustris]|uniref:DnaA ATPase domain-containing protein n=1 Tax=Anaerobacillus alkalilacustris TaxID=393763 RepID=UPI00147216C8|nr:DnaA/Hda family protein [Anaerobacillus alkalilacustris]